MLFCPRIILFLPTPRIIFAHESHESSRNVFNEINGDLIGRTNHTNNMIELVKIRATVQVAIISESNEFVKIRVIRGQIKNIYKLDICGNIATWNIANGRF